MDTPPLERSTPTPPRERSVSAPFASKEETVIIFDWDDTILPTSWLERVQALNGNGQLRPKLQQAMTSLCQVAAQTLDLASALGVVIIITNSVPGWVDQSCRHFMPSILERMRGVPVFARPMHAALTFKNGVFQRECRNFRNVVSVGDGEAERVASLRMQAPFQSRKSAIGPSGPGEDLVAKSIKSVKLIEIPTCQQLIEQHEMLHARLSDVSAYQGCLDLRSQFCGSRSPATNGKAISCTLVHFPTRAQRQPMRFTASNSQLPPLGRGTPSGNEEPATTTWRPRSESDVTSSWRPRSESDSALSLAFADQTRIPGVAGGGVNGGAGVGGRSPGLLTSERWPPGPGTLELTSADGEPATPPRTSSAAPVLAGLEARERARAGTPARSPGGEVRRASSAADAARGLRSSPTSTKMPQSLFGGRGQLLGQGLAARGGAAALREQSAPAGVRGC
eukprot:TRINITY_DN16873_c0_g2_i1.p1 TRINITY_DN16873_c0_g2~~TRINITY_DN16873_c0_g2_i1.p1  ORF type:complete len:497 (+),score=66.10 TRINITY_DN16873_c0_g2_i1:141-1493(+)